MENQNTKLTLKISIKDGDKEIVRNINVVIKPHPTKVYSLDYLLYAAAPRLPHSLAEVVKEAVEIGVDTNTVLELKGHFEEDAGGAAIILKQSVGDVGCKLIYLDKLGSWNYYNQFQGYQGQMLPLAPSSDNAPYQPIDFHYRAGNQ